MDNASSKAPPPADFLPFFEEVIRRHRDAGRDPSHLSASALLHEALEAYRARVMMLATSDTSYARAFRAELARHIHAAVRSEAA